jgi:conjugative relaxase-like TrwC/TraI family protein
MVQITPMPSGPNATAYYTAPDGQSDLNPEKRGTWGGLGAERLGLRGEVSRAAFLALSMNQDPVTGTRLTIRTKKNRTTGYDITFDVPKSLSLYLAETGDKQVERMILESFKETMAEVELYMQTRVRKDGIKDERRDTGNMTYAWYTHHLARPVNGRVDPQHHIQAFVFNATFDPVEGRWKAGSFMKIKSTAPVFQKAFHNRVASKLEAAGFKIRRTEHAFELSNVSRELIERFSKRTMAVVGRAKTALEKVWLLMKTREKKQDIKPDWTKEMTLTDRYTLRNARPLTRVPYRPRAIMAERVMGQEMER